MSDTYARLMIESLPQGGYIIFPGQMYEGHYTPILCAKTTLDEALAFLRSAILKTGDALTGTGATPEEAMIDALASGTSFQRILRANKGLENVAPTFADATKKDPTP